jgi:hypothetical protein
VEIEHKQQESLARIEQWLAAIHALLAAQTQLSARTEEVERGAPTRWRPVDS